MSLVDAAHGRAVVQAAQAMRIDRVTAEVTEALARSGIDALVLKGPTFASWLYDDGGSRPYTDSDLLVAHSAVGRAEEVLRSLGFQRERGTPPGTWEVHAFAWGRDDGAVVDLHHTLLGVGWPDVLFRELWEHRQTLSVGGRTVFGLDEVGRCFHVAQHAAQMRSGNDKPIEDLRRALVRSDVDTWRQAAELSRGLNAEDTFAAGLRQLADGAAVADRLGLPTPTTTEIRLRASAAGNPAISLERWLQERGVRRGTHLLRKVFPSPAWMRQWSARARSGPFGLAIAYATRPFALLRAMPGALWARRNARRKR